MLCGFVHIASLYRRPKQNARRVNRFQVLADRFRCWRCLHVRSKICSVFSGLMCVPSSALCCSLPKSVTAYVWRRWCSVAVDPIVLAALRNSLDRRFLSTGFPLWLERRDRCQVRVVCWVCRSAHTTAFRLKVSEEHRLKLICRLCVEFRFDSALKAAHRFWRSEFLRLQSSTRRSPVHTAQRYIRRYGSLFAANKFEICCGECARKTDWLPRN